MSKDIITTYAEVEQVGLHNFKVTIFREGYYPYVVGYRRTEARAEKLAQKVVYELDCERALKARWAKNKKVIA